MESEVAECHLSWNLSLLVSSRKRLTRITQSIGNSFAEMLRSSCPFFFSLSPTTHHRNDLSLVGELTSGFLTPNSLRSKLGTEMTPGSSAGLV